MRDGTRTFTNGLVIVAIAAVVISCIGCMIPPRGPLPVDTKVFGVEDVSGQGKQVTFRVNDSGKQFRAVAPYRLIVARVQQTRELSPNHIVVETAEQNDNSFYIFADEASYPMRSFNGFLDIETIQWVKPIVTKGDPERSSVTVSELLSETRSRGGNLLMVYSTSSHTSDGGGFLSLLTCGIFPDIIVEGHATSDAIIMDAQSGYVFLATRGKRHDWQPCNLYTRWDAFMDVLQRSERYAIRNVVRDIVKRWPDDL